jgi:hypothetical protein
MNATMVASETKAVPPVVSSIQDIPIAKIRESKTNPRRFFDEAKLAELADFVSRNKTGVMFRVVLCGRRTKASPRRRRHGADDRQRNAPFASHGMAAFNERYK